MRGGTTLCVGPVVKNEDEMPDRDLVYASVIAEMEYLEAEYKNQCTLKIGFQSGDEYIPFFNWRTEDFICRILAATKGISSIFSNQLRLDIMREIAAWAMLALQHCGGCARNINTGDPLDFIEPPLTVGKVQAIVNTERTYQDELGADNTIAGHVIVLQHYVNNTVKQWVTNPGDEYALDVLRKVAGIAVHAMEDYGVTFREPFQP